MPKENPNKISLARKFLQEKIREKELLDFMIDSGFINGLETQEEKTIMKGLYNIAAGKLSHHFRYIFLLRNVIPPLYWYCDSNSNIENLRPTNFISRHSSISPSEPTLAITRLFSATKNRGTLRKLTKETGLTRFAIAHLYLKVDGKFTTSPTEKNVLSLAPYIKPDWWYIYPDEVDENIRNMALVEQLPEDKDGNLIKFNFYCEEPEIIKEAPGSSYYDEKFNELYDLIEKNIDKISIKNKDKMLALLLKDKKTRDGKE